MKPYSNLEIQVGNRELEQRLICDGNVYCFGLHIVYCGSILWDATTVDYVKAKTVHVAFAD